MEHEIPLPQQYLLKNNFCVVGADRIFLSCDTKKNDRKCAPQRMHTTEINAHAACPLVGLSNTVLRGAFKDRRFQLIAARTGST